MYRNNYIYNINFIFPSVLSKSDPNKIFEGRSFHKNLEMDKVKSTLKQFVRDWSREVIFRIYNINTKFNLYNSILKCISNHYPYLSSNIIKFYSWK